MICQILVIFLARLYEYVQHCYALQNTSKKNGVYFQSLSMELRMMRNDGRMK